MMIIIMVSSLIFEIFDCVKNNVTLYSGSYFNLALSVIVAFISGIFAIKLMKKVAKTGKYFYFSVFSNYIYNMLIYLTFLFVKFQLKLYYLT